MIGEIIPTSTKQKQIKLLSPGAEILERLPSVKSHISFLPFLNYLKEKLDGTSGTRADFYRYLIKKIDSDPALLQQVQNVEQLAEHEELLEFLSTAIFPVVSNEEQSNFTLSVPYQFNIFSYSKLFRTLFIDAEEEHLQLPAEISEEHLRQVQCAMIYNHVLDKYYGIQLNECPELVFPVTDAKTGMKRFYRMRYDRRFIDLQLTGKLPLIQDCAVCLNTFRIMDLEHQLKTMPLHLFEAEGFAVWIAEDITLTESLEGIKKILLRQNEHDTDNIDERILTSTKFGETQLIEIIRD